jgi:hypothetical protein
MTRKNSRNNSTRHQSNGFTSKTKSTTRPTPSHSPQLSLYIPQSRRKYSPRQNLASPIHLRTSIAESATVADKEIGTGNGGMGGGDDEEQSEDVDDDNICLVCVAKCTCGKTERQPLRQTPVEPHNTRQRVKLQVSSPETRHLPTKRRGRPTKLRSPAFTPVKNELNDHAYSTRSHANVIVRDGRGRGKNGAEKAKRASEAKTDIIMDISDVNLDGEEDDEEEEDTEDDESDDLGDSGDDVDIEGEEERAIIAEESRRLRPYSDDDDDADEEDEELDEEEDLFQEQHFTSSESSPDEDHEFYQNELYLDATFCRPPEKLQRNSQSSRSRNSNTNDIMLYENPNLRALIEEQGGTIPYGEEIWHDSEEDRVGWECFIDDTDVEMGEDWMHIDDESTRFGGGDTTDEEDFKLLGPPAISPKTATKRKQKKSHIDIVADVITTAHQPPPLATWERDGDEITIIDALPSMQSPLPLPILQTSPPASPDLLPAIDEFFDSSLLVTPTDNDSMSDASASSSYTVTRTPRSRKNSVATSTSVNTDPFVTPANRGRDKRKVPLGSYRRKVMLGERGLEAQEKSVFLKEWYTLQERRNLRKMSKSRNMEFLEFSSSPQRGRRREKLRTAQRARRGSTELDMQYIKRRRTSDVQGSGSSTAAFMERLGMDLGAGDISEMEDYDDDEFDTESGAVNGVGERMVLEDDLELAQFIIPPPGGIDLSPLFGAVDA